MRILRPATRIYPALQSRVDERARALGAIERHPNDMVQPCDPPSEGREHWEAVWSAYAASSHEAREANAADATELRAAQPLPIPIERGAHRLIASVPPPDGVGPAWIAVYLHMNDVVVERVEVPATTRAAIYHFDARALVAVELLRFTDIHPHFFVESVYDEDGEMHEWHDAVDFARMPTDPDEYILAEQFSAGTKLGGFAVLNAQYDETPCASDGEPMCYALHLAADFFDCMFGDAGSLHVWLSKDESAVRMDSA